MKLIILAAGRGSRLSKYTIDKPKGMLNFLGKPIIEYQIEVFRKAGIKDINIIRGYKKNKINFPEIQYFDNDNYSKTNMVESLMQAEEILNEECIVTYSDLILDYNTVNSILGSNVDIGVTVDVNFQEYWECRLGDKYLEDMESMVISNGKIESLGKSLPSSEELDGRYVGAIKFSKNGINQLVHKYKEYSRISNKVHNVKRDFVNWHMTDLLNSMIIDGCKVCPIIISRGWLEFDTDEDYENYEQWHKTDNLSRFINLY